MNHLDVPRPTGEIRLQYMENRHAKLVQAYTTNPSFNLPQAGAWPEGSHFTLVYLVYLG